MMNKENIEELKTLLDSPKKIAITMHRNPDGDAMGSTLGLYHFLKQKGHDATVIVPNEFPDFLEWLPSANDVIVFEKENSQAVTILEAADIVFTLDFNAFSRTGEQMQKVSKNLSALNNVYELQLKGSSAHLAATEKFQGQVTDMMQNLSDSVEDTRLYKENMSLLSKNLTDLNSVYGNMLQAMTIKG